MKSSSSIFIIALLQEEYMWVILSSYRELPTEMSKTLPISIGGPLQAVKSSPQETKNSCRNQTAI
jgi:hypothetical protein